jgi:hypothetical protein
MSTDISPFYNRGIEEITLPDYARVWVFQADSFLTDSEAELLRHEGVAFAKAWKAHGKDLGARFAVLCNLFVVMSVDETREGATGCSIDSFMRFMLQKQEEFGVSFTNRMCIAYLENEEIRLCKSSDLMQLKINEKITPETLVFDNLVTTLGEFKYARLKPAAQTWLGSILCSVAS